LLTPIVNLILFIIVIIQGAGEDSLMELSCKAAGA